MRMTYERDCRMWLLFALSMAISTAGTSLIGDGIARRQLHRETALAVQEAVAHRQRATLLDWSSALATYRWQVGTATTSTLPLTLPPASTANTGFTVGPPSGWTDQLTFVQGGTSMITCRWPNSTRACPPKTQFALITALYADGTYQCRLACEAKR